MAKEGILEALQMPDSRRRILLELKEKGGLTADELSTRLQISAVAVRRHLDNLRNTGLVDYQEVKQGMGRPSFVYSLTDKTDHIFPRNYEELVYDILNTIREMYGPEAIDAIFNRRYERIKNAYQLQVNAPTLGKRLDQLVKLRQADGYMADWHADEDGLTYLLTESNCPIQHVAASCCQACEQDLKLFNELLDADIVRQDHLVEGDNACTYEIRPKALINPQG